LVLAPIAGIELPTLFSFKISMTTFRIGFSHDNICTQRLDPLKIEHMGVAFFLLFTGLGLSGLGRAILTLSKIVPPLVKNVFLFSLIEPIGTGQNTEQIFAALY
jgi:hypothetical protein